MRNFKLSNPVSHTRIPLRNKRAYFMCCGVNIFLLHIITHLNPVMLFYISVSCCASFSSCMSPLSLPLLFLLHLFFFVIAIFLIYHWPLTKSFLLLACSSSNTSYPFSAIPFPSLLTSSIPSYPTFPNALCLFAFLISSTSSSFASPLVPRFSLLPSLSLLQFSSPTSLHQQSRAPQLHGRIPLRNKRAYFNDSFR